MIILKRIIEIFFSIILLIFLFSIILLIILLIIFFFKEGPIFFKQERIGINGRTFIIYKFRTMFNNAENELKNILDNNPKLNNEYSKNCKLENDPRIIGKIGIFLRRTSLDEIPQFINIIKGDMTFVGPRPFLKDEIIVFKDKFEKLCSVKPGITGLWQVSGRNNLNLKQRVELDIKYIDTKSFFNDITIIFKTFIVIFQKKGAC